MRRTGLAASAAAFGLSVLFVLGNAACGGSSSEAVVMLADNAELKRSIVVDADGSTLYMFTADTNGEATCVGDRPAPDCGKVWPPLTAAGKLEGGEGIDEDLLGTTERTDGRKQVTYNNHPLYYFRGYQGTPADKGPGDANGQNYFGLWYVLAPDGTPIRR
jgi:predicted lipoprotein with Yx(FWY)xxD motif